MKPRADLLKNLKMPNSAAEEEADNDLMLEPEMDEAMSMEDAELEDAMLDEDNMEEDDIEKDDMFGEYSDDELLEELQKRGLIEDDAAVTEDEIEGEELSDDDDDLDY